MATEAKLRQLADKGCPVYYFYSSDARVNTRNATYVNIIRRHKSKTTIIKTYDLG